MLKEIEYNGKNLFENLNFLYIDNQNIFKNSKFEIITRIQPSLEKIENVFYVINYENEKIVIRPHSTTYISDSNDRINHVDLSNYVRSICRKKKIDEILSI